MLPFGLQLLESLNFSILGPHVNSNQHQMNVGLNGPGSACVVDVNPPRQVVDLETRRLGYRADCSQKEPVSYAWRKMTYSAPAPLPHHKETAKCIWIKPQILSLCFFLSCFPHLS